jgi:hypothetical protein
MLEASWQDRVDALGEGHYVRYDESTAIYLADTSQLLLDRYDGTCAGCGTPPTAIRTGSTSREVQAVWDELRPYADATARTSPTSSGSVTARRCWPTCTATTTCRS